jgi:hypothetical protein
MELESGQETRTCYINGLLLIALVNLWLHVHGGQHNAALTWIVTNHVKRSSPQNSDNLEQNDIEVQPNLDFFMIIHQSLGAQPDLKCSLQKKIIFIYYYFYGMHGTRSIYVQHRVLQQVFVCILAISASERARMVNILIPV